MALAKKVKPPSENEKPRLKLMLFGQAGVGKTTSSIWPNSYLIDGERGTEHYDKMLSDRGCARVHTTDVEEASVHLRELMSTKHDYKTVVVDPITTFYEDSQNKWNDRYINFHTSKDERDKASMQDFES